jgi:tetratricopeptide (TPR) repeat protein
MKMGKCGEKHDITLFLLGSTDATLDNQQDSKDWYNKGITLGKLGKSDEAITAFDNAIDVNPQYSLAWYYRGVPLKKLGKSAEAQKYWAK